MRSRSTLLLAALLLAGCPKPKEQAAAPPALPAASHGGEVQPTSIGSAELVVGQGGELSPNLRGADAGGAAAGREPGLDELTALITDSTCLARGHHGGHEHRECAIRCIQSGADVALVEKGTNAAFLAVAPPGKSITEQLLPHVGSEALVRGVRREDGGTSLFEVREVYPSHRHASLFGGAVGMAGELHLEVLALRAGEVRVYLSDRFRRPVEPREVRGSVEVRDGEGEPRRAELELDGSGRFLSAKVGPLPALPMEVRAVLRLGALGVEYGVPEPSRKELSMSFVVDPLENPGAPATRTRGSPHPFPLPVGEGEVR